MFPKFLQMLVRKEGADLGPDDISRTRKIIVWLFIIGFWLIYYYVR